MRQVAIVGVEGSGKTVMLAGLGELYSNPDEKGYFLTPKNFSTARYVSEKIAKMRNGEWPVATPEDLMQGLDWTLRKKVSSGRPQDICVVSCLDFAGEVYRAAFCSEESHEETEEERTLKGYIDACDDLIVLINLRDVIRNGLADTRTEESIWITNAILAYALDNSEDGKSKRAAIVLSQSDSYMNIIESCGGARGVLERYLPHVYHSYDWLDIFDACAVDLVKMDVDGNIFPHPDFQPKYLKSIVEWIRKGVEQEAANECAPQPAAEVVSENVGQTVRISRPKKKFHRVKINSTEIQGSSFENTIDQSPRKVRKDNTYFSTLVKTFDYHGRSGRKEFWRFWGVTTALLFLSVRLAGSSNSGDQEAGAIITGLIALGAVLPGFSLSVRRFHDVGITGWVLLLVFIPYVGWLIPLVGFVKGQDKTNRYGDPV